ncbi:hypothetical protein HPP92_011020 [Vanilla planifolia]|uniref:PWWP domain-containing protein n=1 Tax=Vanilla planifolia TaxID=51239 RepID=A0A835PHT5_VANPL|nr:hypothetical protein HPP92_026260 [Vanilla planifolia]KAG0482936.1 hypothetical protein HPP92_011020 [Vanilla planifolia]
MAQKLPDLEARVSGNVAEGGYGSLAVETKMDMDVGVNDLVSLVEENRIPFLQSGGWMHGFRTGDMVWGKVKSHPWWPGHIFNEAFASPSVRRTKREGHVLVAFFGDSSYGWFDPAELIPFEPYFLRSPGKRPPATLLELWKRQ